MEKKKKAILDLQFYHSVLNNYNPTFWRDARVRHFRYRYFTVSQLMHFDVHLGGNERDIIETSYWFLYGRRKGFVFIDLHPTVLVLRRLILIITEVIRNYGKFMFVDSDRQYCWGTQRLAIQVGEAYCIYSWVGGLLTNFKKIWAFYNVALRYTDWGLLRRPKARLKFILQGLDALYGPPSLIFINRLEHGHNAAAESHAVSIPSIGLVDLNTYSDEATYLIPSNDDSKRTVSYFNQLITRAVMKSKLHRALSFIRRKNLREQRGNLILEDRLIDMRKMFDVYKSLETRHTVHFRMPLRDWAALRKARTVFLGFPIPYLSTKTAISFIFKRLRREYFIDRERLNTLRKLKQKASFIYKRYYAQFFNVKPRLDIFRDITDKTKLRKEFFTVTSKKHHKRFPIKVLDILQKVRWLFDLKHKYRHLSAWLKWKVYKQYKDMSPSTKRNNKSEVMSSSKKNRLSTLSRFYKFLLKEYYKINKLYFYYIRHYYKPLKFFFQKWKARCGFTLFERQIRGKNKKTLGDGFNEWYFGKRFYETNIKKDAHFIWRRLLLKYDVMKKRNERNKSLRDFRLRTKSQATLQTNNNQIRPKTFKNPQWNDHSTMKPRKSTIRNREVNVKKYGYKRVSNKFVRSFRQRNWNPYSWRFRRLWKPRRISHFFKLNPYYLALLRNRPWFPMREIIRFQLEEPQNPNQFILKDKVLYNLLKGKLSFFLTDNSFATHRDFFSFPQRVSFEGDFLYFPKRLLRSRSVDYFRPVGFFDIIPRDLHWYYNYWSLKLDPKRILNYFKLLHTSPDHLSRLSRSEKYLYNFYHAILEIQKETEKSAEEKDLEMKKGVDNAPVFNIWREVIDKRNQPLFYHSFAANNPQLHKVYNKPVFRYQQSTLDRSRVFLDFYKNTFIDSFSKASTDDGSKIFSKQALSLRAKSRLKMLQRFSDNIGWASDYYELINYNRSWMQSYSVFFDSRDIMEDYRSFEDKLIFNKWNLITHLHRYQRTPSFLNLFILGRVKASTNTAKIQSPHLRRLKRKIDWKRQQRFIKQQPTRKNYFRKTGQSDPRSNIKQNRSTVYRQADISTHLDKKVKNQKWLNKKTRLSSYYLMKKKQKMDSLKKLFPFYFWLRWFKGLNLLGLFQKNMVHSYLLVFNKILNRFKRINKLKSRITGLKQLFSLFRIILRLLVYKTGNLAVFKVLPKLNQSLNLESRLQLSEDIISYFSKFLNHVNEISDEKRPSKHAKFVSLAYFWRWFYKNTAKAYFKPNPIFASDGFTLIDLYHRKSVFFNKHGFTFLRDNAFNKATGFYGKKDKFAFEKAHYDYLAGIPDKTAQRIFMKMNSKFNYNKYQKFFWLKLSQRFRGRVFLEALFNDFKYGKIKSPRHYRMMREVVYRLHHINKQRHSIFVEMFQNNPYVDRPHLKANIDKYSGSHLFLLKNYGPKRFLRKRKFDTLDVFYFMGWFLRHKKGVPANLRRKFMFLFRMWNNKSMFLSS